MKTTPGITALLRHARLLCLEELSGQPATTDVLQYAGNFLRAVVIRQVAAGLWRDHGVTEPRQMTGLEVTVAFGNTMLGEAPLRIDWNFTRTALPLLVVETEKKS